jgi:DHA1 family multidrug resistance protein-like MFS transporter
MNDPIEQTTSIGDAWPHVAGKNTILFFDLCIYPHDQMGLKNSMEWETPDFQAMIKILFWNSQGFFFFGFIIPFVAGVLLSATGTQIGIIFAMRVIGGLISLPIAGWLTDQNYSKQKLVLFGAVGRGVAYIVLFAGILAQSLNILMLGMFVQGFGVGVFWPPYDAMIAEKTSKFHRAYAFGQRGSKIGWGNLVGTLISFTVFSIGTSFFPTALWFIFSPLLFFAYTNFYGGWLFYRHVDHKLTFEGWICQKDRQSHRCVEEITPKINKIPLSTKYRLSTLAIFGLVVLFIGLAASSMNETIAKPFIQLYLINNIESNPTLVMLIFFPSEILAMLVAPKLGEWADKINLAVGLILTCTIGALLTWFLIHAETGLVFGLILILDAILARVTQLIIANLLSRVSPNHRGRIFGFKTWVAHVGEMIGPILGGILWDTSGETAPFLSSIVLEILLIPIFLTALAILSKQLVEKIDSNEISG